MTQGATPKAEETLCNVDLTIDNAGEHRKLVLEKQCCPPRSDMGAYALE